MTIYKWMRMGKGVQIIVYMGMQDPAARGQGADKSGRYQVVNCP